MTNAMKDLEPLIGPMRPEGDRAEADWDMVHLALTATYPEDYRQFLKCWGQGKFADFIHFFAPNSGKKALRLPQAVQGFVATYATLKSNRPEKYLIPILPAKGGFLPFAITDNGDYIGWRISGAASDSWTVSILQDEEGDAVDTGLSFAAFLRGVAEGTLRPKAFPEDFWDVPLTYQVYSDS